MIQSTAMTKQELAVVIVAAIFKVQAEIQGPPLVTDQYLDLAEEFVAICVRKIKEPG